MTEQLTTPACQVCGHNTRFCSCGKQDENEETAGEFLRGAAQSCRRREGCQCDVCGEDIAINDGQLDRCARIERGDFDLTDRANDNIKFDLFICQKCFLEDEDLCRFFNRLGRRVR